jgi:hypothetical protein
MVERHLSNTSSGRGTTHCIKLISLQRLKFCKTTVYLDVIFSSPLPCRRECLRRWLVKVYLVLPTLESEAKFCCRHLVFLPWNTENIRSIYAEIMQIMNLTRDLMFRRGEHEDYRLYPTTYESNMFKNRKKYVTWKLELKKIRQHLYCDTERGRKKLYRCII